MNILGIDIGGTKCAVVLGKLKVEGDIEILDKILYATADYPGPVKMLSQLLAGIDVLLKKKQLTAKDIASVGISCGGPLDSKKGVILSPPNLPGCDEVHIVDYFEKNVSVPVAIQNDANACALAELKFGAGRGTRNMVFLTFGTGMGA
jgi:glucokinase